MTTKPSYLALAAQLLLVLAVAVVLGVLLEPWSVQVPAYAAAILGAALVTRTVSGRRTAGALEQSPEALARCSLILPAERWPVGRLFQFRVGATRSAWAPGVLGVGSGEVTFVPRAKRFAGQAWQGRVRAVQVKAMWPGTVVAVRMHGARETAQFTLTRREEEVRELLAAHLPVVDGWDAALVPEVAPRPVPPVQRSWPELYRVRLELADGTSASYDVVTWLDEHKAEALAVGRHTYLHGEEPVVQGAQVEDVGPAHKDERGLVQIRGLVFDRREF